MALTDESNGGNMVMPVGPMYGGGNGNDLFGNNGSWLILFILLLMCGGWGNGFGFGGGFGGGVGGFAADGAMLYPWMNQTNQLNGGFRGQMIHSDLTGIQSAVTSGFGDTALGIAGINQNICQSSGNIINGMNAGFAGTTAAITGAQNALAQQMYGNQLSDLERSFAAQTATTQGLTAIQTGQLQNANALQAQLAQCCCDNRAATADLKYTVATENCQDRYEAANNTRDIIANQTANTQAILDKLCALELDGVKSQLAQAQRENVALQNQVNMATMQASQTAQTAQILAGQAAEIDGVYNRLKNCPVNTVPVYGNQPIFTNLGNNCGCGCA